MSEAHVKATETLADLSGEYHVEELRGGLLAVRQDLWPAFRGAGFTLGGKAEWGTSDLSGRRPLGEFEVDGVSYVVRHFQHGGVFRWITRERFAEAARPFEELRLARELTRRGISTLESVAARAEALQPFGWRLALVTKRLKGVVDVAQFLERVRRGEVAIGERQRLARALGEFVGNLHRIGFEHADLTPRNVLMESEPAPGVAPKLWVIDLDRSRFHDVFDEELRRRNVRRLFRFVRRREARGLRFLTLGDRWRFLAGYGRGLGQSGWDPHDFWRGIARDDGRRDRWHRMGWAAEELLGGGPETRDG